MLFSYKYGVCHYNMTNNGKFRTSFYDNKQVIPIKADFIYPVAKSSTERVWVY